MRPMNLTLTAMAMSLFAAAAVTGQTPDRPAARADALRDHAQAAQRLGDAAHLMVRPGLVADREARTVRLWAAATAIQHDEPVEFFLITDDSGKAYEALAVAFVEGADVVEAMRFIGMAPGKPVDYDALRAWPKGERVTMHFEWKQDGGEARSARAESLIHDEATGRPLDPTGLIFTGSYRLPAGEGGQRPLAADAYGVGPIASTYNEPTTIFDVPRRSAQGAVYERYTPADAFTLMPWQPVQVVIRPQRPDGPPRVVEITMDVTLGRPDPTAKQLGALRIGLVGASGERIAEPGDVAAALAKLADLAAHERDPYVTVRIGDAVPLGLAHGLAQVFAAAEGPQGLRIEPPPPGHLYYRAFLPPRDLRERSKRLFHAWELRLAPADADPPRLTLIETYDKRNDMGSLLTGERITHPADPAALAAKLKQVDGDRPRELFVHAPGATRYGRLMRVLQPVMKTHNTIHVYLE